MLKMVNVYYLQWKSMVAKVGNYGFLLQVILCL